MKIRVLLIVSLLVLVSSLHAQHRLEISEPDGFSWVKVMDNSGAAYDQLVGALDADDSVLVPTRYCYILYTKGFLVADSCADDEMVGQALYSTEGELLIPASRGYLKIRAIDKDGFRYLLARTRMDGHYYWAVCDIYGHEVIAPAMYSDLMESPFGTFYYTPKGFAVKYNKKYTYLHIYVDEEGRMYQLQDNETHYLFNYDE